MTKQENVKKVQKVTSEEGLEPGIYRYEKRIQLAVKCINPSPETGQKRRKTQPAKIIPENRDIILRYLTFLKGSGRSLARQDKLIRTVKKLAELLEPTPFRKATRQDLEEVMAKATMGKKGKHQVRVTDYTFRDFQEITKQFFGWLFEVEDPRHEGYPKIVSWIRPKTPGPTISSSDLLTPTEIKQLISATTDLRMKALVAVCAECGLRVGEALRLRIRDVAIQENYAEIAVPIKGKTGTRKALSIGSLPLMYQWMDQHPDRDNPEAWLWTDDTYPLTYDRARFKLLEMKRKAKISKRLYFHLFRHTSATSNAGLGENMLREIYGWSRNSSEPSTYVHLSGDTVKKTLLEKAGVQQKTETESKVVKCPRCGCLNAPDASICFKCKSALSISNAVSIATVQKELDSLKQSLLSVKRDMFRRDFNLPVSASDQQIDKAMAKEEKRLESLRRKGWVVNIGSDGTIVESPPKNSTKQPRQLGRLKTLENQD
jgi:integrase/recombinase XerD